MLSQDNKPGGLRQATKPFLLSLKYYRYSKRRLDTKIKQVAIYGLSNRRRLVIWPPFYMKDKIHPKYVDAEIRCACGNVIKTRSTKPSILIGICNVCHPFYTGTQKFIDTAGRVDKFQQRLAKTQAAQAAQAVKKKKK